MNYELLSRCFGTACGLVSLPLNVRLGPDGHTRIGAWTACYHRRGLAFGTDRQTVEALRTLVNAGLLTTGGMTQGKSWKLTPAGVLTAMQCQGLDPAESRDLLRRIATAESKSRVIMPGLDKPLAMGWALVPGCGAGMGKALKNEAAWQAYRSELHGLQVWGNPLSVLGYIETYTDANALFWGCRVTDAGRTALTDWPAAPAPATADDERCFAAWDEGYSAADSYAVAAEMKPG
jgi:hypothetical protein